MKLNLIRIILSIFIKTSYENITETTSYILITIICLNRDWERCIDCQKSLDIPGLILLGPGLFYTVLH